MEQHNQKFRLRLNLFDAIVLIIALAVGAFVLWNALKPQAAPSSGGQPPPPPPCATPSAFRGWPRGTAR